MNINNNLKTVYIKWNNSCSHHGWAAATDVLSIVDSFGLLVNETKNSVTIATSYDRTSGLWSDQMVIPRSAIVEYRKSRVFKVCK